MKKFLTIVLTIQLLLLLPDKLSAQKNSDMQEFGLTAGAFANFPANQHYLDKNIKVFYIAPYLRTGKHEFSAGLVLPLSAPGLYYTDNNINSRPGALAGYKFYVFNVYSRENLFVHYSFQYLRFSRNFDIPFNGTIQTNHLTETDMYINNVIGLGYNLFLDINGRFGFYYTLDYVISQAGHKLQNEGFTDNTWNTKYVWNNISTNVGFIIKLTSIKKKDKN